MRRLTGLTLTVLSLFACLPACAVPPDRDIRSIVHQDDDGRRTPLLDPRGLPVYDDLGHGLEPEITVVRKGELGYDLVFDFENTTNRPARLGRIEVGIITLGPDFSWLNLNRHCEFIETTRRSFSVQVRPYPGSFYSPVGVVHNDEFAVGVSLLYDLLQDRHEVGVRIAKPGGVYANGPGGAGLSIGFDLGNDSRGRGRVQRSATLMPGEQREYRVAVRAIRLDRPVTTDGPQHWLKTIEPYRRHFETLYGGVTYERDPRPVRAVPAAGTHNLGSDNPMGFNGASRQRPDLVGWGPLVTSILRPRGFERTMLWSPGGVYLNNRQLNFPSRFMSQLRTTPRLNTAFDTQEGLPRLGASGHELGLWWGRAAMVSEAWDSPSWRPLNLSYPDRVQLALDELALANDAGASVIGLDDFIPLYLPVWQQYEWILVMRARYPHMTFVIEPLSCDILHSLGPTFDKAWRGEDDPGARGDRFTVHKPHSLADYLLPGHAIWGHFRYDHARTPANVASVQRDAERLAELGFVPVMATNISLTDPSRAFAHPTWLSTVPDALKTPAHATATPPVLPIPGAGDLPDAPDTDDPGDRGNGNGNGDRGGEANDGKDDDAEIPTRPFMLPNGRVIRLPIYEPGK